MSLDLVRQRPKNICSASNDQEENPRTPPQKKKKDKKRKKSRELENKKKRKSWNLVVLGNFQIFLEFHKFLTVCVHGRSAEIFPETCMFGTK